MRISKLVMSIAAILALSVTNAIACPADGPAQRIKPNPIADSCEEKARESAQKSVREFFGFWKTLYPEFIKRSLSTMSESNLTYQGKLTAAEDGFDGAFTAIVQLRDTARPDYPTLSQYCYDAAGEATSKLDALRGERLALKTHTERTNKMIELGNQLSDTTPGAAKPLIKYVSGKALLVVYQDAPIKLNEPVGKFSKDFKGYLTTVLVLDVADFLDSEEKNEE